VVALTLIVTGLTSLVFAVQTEGLAPSLVASITPTETPANVPLPESPATGGQALAENPTPAFTPNDIQAPPTRMSLPNPLPTPTLTPWPCDGPPSDWELYAVRWGDTIRSLAQRRGASAEWVICYNRLIEPIKIGQLLYLPPLAPDTPTATATPTPTGTSSPTPTATPWPCEGPLANWVLYNVRYGDDLYSLARERGTTVELIICYNHLTGPFQVGQLIYLPPEPPTPVPPPTTPIPPPTTPVPPPTTPAPPLMPDLVVYQLSGPDQAQPSQVINQHMNLMVTNQGEAGTRATGVDIVISRDTTIDTGDRWIGDGYVPAVAPNQTVTGGLTLVQIPEDWPTSEVYIGAILDPLNEQPESDENNNTGHLRINVATPPSPPELLSE